MEVPELTEMEIAFRMEEASKSVLKGTLAEAPVSSSEVARARVIVPWEETRMVRLNSVSERRGIWAWSFMGGELRR